MTPTRYGPRMRTCWRPSRPLSRLPRQPLGAAAESVAELCDGITVSASRLRAAVHRGQDQASWSPDVTSGAWQWMAQAAAITSHLSELALRCLAERAGQLPAPAGDTSPAARRG